MLPSSARGSRFTTASTLANEAEPIDDSREAQAVRVLPIRSIMVSYVVSDVPRQFAVTWQKSRCSILFHLLVPGGR